MHHLFLMLLVGAAFGLPGLIGFMIGESDSHHHHCNDDWNS